NHSRELYGEILDLVIPAIETGVIGGKGKHIDQPRRELRPAPLKSFEGRKFCGSLSGTSMHTAARLGFGNMVLMLPQRGKEAPPDMYAEIWAQERPGTLPPPPMVSGNYYIDGSADYALEQGEIYLA